MKWNCQLVTRVHLIARYKFWYAMCRTQFHMICLTCFVMISLNIVISWSPMPSNVNKGDITQQGDVQWDKWGFPIADNILLHNWHDLIISWISFWFHFCLQSLTMYSLFIWFQCTYQEGVNHSIWTVLANDLIIWIGRCKAKTSFLFGICVRQSPY